MKKILLSLMMIGAFTAVKAQLVLNEIYPDPSIPPNEEYIELFNTGSDPIQIGCYTLVTYAPGSPSTIYVYDLPSYEVGAFGFVVFASDEPIHYQGNQITGYTGLNAFSWNENNSAALTKYTISGNSLVSASITSPVTDLIPITGGNSTTLNIMVFDESGNLVTGFFANNSHQIPQELIDLGDELIGACGTTLHFGQATTNSEIFDLNQAPGNDNGYRRQNNGFCGTWEKAEPASSYSPGTSNGTGAGDENLVQISALPHCYVKADGTNSNGTTTWDISITVTQQSLLNAYYTIYEDRGDDGGDLPEAGDAPALTSGIISSTSPVVLEVEASAWRDIYIQVVTNSNCISRLEHLASGCAPLPVNLKAFNAVRSGSDVNLAWQTAIESQNKGFEIQRLIGSGGGWETIGFVASQAAGGNSNSSLSYVFTDLNNRVRGITQYRLKQVDIDGHGTYSVIRSVRGQGQMPKTIIYPNPSSDGKVSIVFDDVNGIRDVSVTDMSGRMIKQMKRVTNNNIQIDNLGTGMYTVRILNTETGEQVVEKFVVNKR